MSILDLKDQNMTVWPLLASTEAFNTGPHKHLVLSSQMNLTHVTWTLRSSSSSQLWMLLALTFDRTEG